MADTTIQKQGEVFISQSEYDALRLAGNLQSNTKYHITKTPEKYVAKKTGSDATVYVYGYNDSGDVSVPTSFGVLSSSVVVRDSNGNTSVATPTSNTHAANKEYVDSFQTITILGADE